MWGLVGPAWYGMPGNELIRRFGTVRGGLRRLVVTDRVAETRNESSCRVGKG